MKRSDFIKALSAMPIAMGLSSLSDLSKLSDSLTPSEKMPVLFLGHGSPMNAIEENQFVRGFRNAAANIKTTPTAILCVSAHWFTRGTKVTAMEMPPTIHDFGGFPQALFDVEYPAPGHPELANETAKILSPTEVELDQNWGLDHGAWSVIKHMYPDANIPVIQLSIDYTKPATYHYELGKKLSELRSKGVLIVGSGNIIHNLRMVDWRNINTVDHGYDWAHEAHEEINKYILDGDFKPLLEYKSKGTAWNNAIPTPEHYLPLLYSLALREGSEEITLFNDHLLAGSLSMTSLRIG
ncbi:MAG: 4,5-DOPA dioxygenase extradiol [Bacteroidetes bacterium]|nr:MAG: 4,5-DOPA dioxygenase extradiol [Bacteroidota bacterium]